MSEPDDESTKRVDMLGCVMFCFNTPEFVSQYNRLSGTSIGVDNRQGIVRLVDEATGYAKVLDEKRDVELREFVRFVIKYVWTPVWMQEHSDVLAAISPEVKL